MLNRIMLVLSFALLGTSQAASAFQIEAATQIQNDGSVAAQACNYGYNGTISCRIYVRGTYLNNHGMEAWENAVLSPGECGWAYVFPAYGMSFANSFGTANCSFY